MEQTAYIFLKGEIHELKLKKEINDSPFMSIKCNDVMHQGNGYIVIMADSLPSEQYTVLQSIVQQHDPTPPTDNAVQMVSTIENTKIDDVYLNFKLRPLLFDIPEGNNDGHPYEFWYIPPYPVMVLGSTMDFSADMVGDAFKLELVGDFNAGKTIQKAYAGQTSVIITPGSENFIYPGFKVGSYEEHWGEVIRKEGNRLFLDRPLATDIDPLTDLIAEYEVVEKYLITSAPLTFWASRDTTRGANAAAQQPMKFYYWNNTGSAKKVQLCLAFYL